MSARWIGSRNPGTGWPEVVCINVCERYPIYDADKTMRRIRARRTGETAAQPAIDKDPELSESLSVRHLIGPYFHT